MEMLQNDAKRQRDSSEASPAESDAKRTKNESTSMMDSKEIASAVALASLASFSPSTRKPTTKPLADAPRRDVGAATTSATLETRSPSSEPIPISPDVRSPIRPIRRVHFASNVKEKTPNEDLGRQHVEFQSPVQGTVAARPFPVRMHQNGFVFPAMSRPQQPHWMSGPVRMPPQRIMQQPFGPSSHHWICDYCNAAAFNTYEEACLHEESCKHRVRQAPAVTPRLPPGASGLLPMGGGAGNVQDEGETGLTFAEAPVAGTEWFSGSISLSLPESDAEWLSEINCFIRKHCVEAFSATEEDVLSTSKRGRISLHQVGIRCCHCKHRPLKERAVAAVSYPTSVAGIYESVKRFHRVHVEHCDCIPDDVRAKMAELHNLNVWIPTTRQYWTDSARALGMVDTEEGIRFSCDPQYIREANKPDGAEAAQASGVASKPDGKVLADGDHIVFPEDMRIVPAYVYFLMRQVESCHFSEVDRFVARSKGPVGYPGFQCRHCSGHAGLGKYFPVSAKTLSTNSTSQNIHAHLLKCRKCPEHVKEKLVALKLEKSRSPRLEPGWRKIFFDKVWHRLHG